jgi:alpha-glucosidase
MLAMPNNKNKSRRATIALLTSLLLTACENPLQLVSPNDGIKLEVDVSGAGHATYSVTAGNELLIRPSDLGLILKDRLGFTWNMRLVDATHSAHDSQWELPWGERRIVRENYREMLVELENPDGRQLLIRFRAFDDGIGFRYEIPNPERKQIEVLEELTEFNIAADATAFWQPGAGKIRYEHLYRTTSLQEVESAHTPFTVRLPSGKHLSIHEAALSNYSAFTLKRKSDGDLVASLRPWVEGGAVRTEERLVSSWRTLQIAEDAPGLINSSLILNLNEPNKLGDVSWVEPGKYVGIWWAIHVGQKTWHPGPDHGATTAEAKRYIDFAANYGFDGVLIEGWNKGWAGEGLSYTEAYPDFDLQSVSEYARERGVHLIGHHETYGDVPGYEDELEAALDLYASVGVPQVKTGYVADAGKLQRRGENGEVVHEWHDSQYAVLHQQRVLEEAAKRKISINTHEPVKDTGLRRTYPNWLTREGSRGQEFAIWGETPNPPEHTVLLAYTRMLAGPMDFTPGMFNLHPKGPDSPHRIQTTLAKQLALYVVLYSPIQMVPDLFENYATRPDVFQFIVDVPTDWEESFALAGEVGDFVAVVRKTRGGDDWYLGAITDEEARTLEVPLTFLDAGKPYIAEIYRDSDDAHWDSSPYGIEIETHTLNSETTLELRLAAGGGTAIRFRPAEKAAK